MLLAGGHCEATQKVPDPLHLFINQLLEKSKSRGETII